MMKSPDHDDDLTIALEQLRAAEEDLRLQNSALYDTNQEIARERERYAQIFDALPAAFILTTADGMIVETNQRARDLLDPVAGRAAGKPLTLFIAERGRRELRHAINQIASGRSAEVTLVTVIGRGDSPESVIQMEAAAVDLDGRRHISWLARVASREIGRANTRYEQEHIDRLATERALRRFRFLTEASRHLTGERDVNELCRGVARAVTKFLADHCAIYLIEGSSLVRCSTSDADPDKSAFIEMLLRRFEITAESTDGLLWRAILTGDPQTVPAVEARDEQNSMRAFFMGLREQGARNAVVLPLRRRDHSFGALVALGTSPVPRFQADDVGILIEVATRTALAIENAQLMGKLERANEEKSEFMAVLSHELRTPLTAVIGYADLLLAGIPEPMHPQARQHIERIRTSAWHQLTIVEQLLTHTRPVPPPDAVVISTIDLADMVKDVIDLNAASAAHKGLTLGTDVPPALMLRTDAGRLRQILINLVGNAVKYTEHGEVQVHVRGSDEGVYITVTDTGPGIAEEALPHVFDAYWRGSRTGSGVGLGLNVSQKLARLLGGDITVESEVGVGSSFTLRLPSE